MFCDHRVQASPQLDSIHRKTTQPLPNHEAPTVLRDADRPVLGLGRAVPVSAV